MTPLVIPPEIIRSIDDQRVRLGEIELSAGLDDQTQLAVRQVIDESFVVGFRGVMMTAVGLALISAVCALIIIS